MTRALLLAAALWTVSASADEGTDLWMDKCQKCHGEDGRAKTRAGRKEKIADFTHATWQREHTDTEIRTVIEEGSTENRKMKAYKDRLTPEQIDALVFHIRDLKASH